MGGAEQSWQRSGSLQESRDSCVNWALRVPFGVKGSLSPPLGDESLERPKDLIKRHFVSWEPNELWCADITYVKTRAGWAHVAPIIDVFSRMIVGWKVANSLKSDLATDALAMAMAPRR